MPWFPSSKDKLPELICLFRMSVVYANDQINKNDDNRLVESVEFKGVIKTKSGLKILVNKILSFKTIKLCKPTFLIFFSNGLCHLTVLLVMYGQFFFLFFCRSMQYIYCFSRSRFYKQFPPAISLLEVFSHGFLFF